MALGEAIGRASRTAPWRPAHALVSVAAPPALLWAGHLAGLAVAGGLAWPATMWVGVVAGSALVAVALHAAGPGPARGAHTASPSPS